MSASIAYSKWFFVIFVILGLTVGLRDIFHRSLDDCNHPTLRVTSKDQDVQKRIEFAPAGAVVFLESGQYQFEEFQRSMNISLCGAGVKQTILTGSSSVLNFLARNTDDEISIKLENLTIRQNPDAITDETGVALTGTGHFRVVLKNVLISRINGFGIKNFFDYSPLDFSPEVSAGGIQLNLDNVEISESSSGGIYLGYLGNGTIKLEMEKVVIAKNGIQDAGCQSIFVGGATMLLKFHDLKIVDNGCNGLALYGGGQIEGKKLVISRNREGLMLVGPDKITLEEIEITDNNKDFGVGGISIPSAGPTMIRRGLISRNGGHGIHIGAATVTVDTTLIEHNGQDRECLKSTGLNPHLEICNGIFLHGPAQLTIIDSIIRENLEWGIGAELKKCGFEKDLFEGKVILKGANVIERNNVAGNHTGEVCLP